MLVIVPQVQTHPHVAGAEGRRFDRCAPGGHVYRVDGGGSVAHLRVGQFKIRPAGDAFIEVEAGSENRFFLRGVAAGIAVYQANTAILGVELADLGVLGKGASETRGTFHIGQIAGIPGNLCLQTAHVIGAEDHGKGDLIPGIAGIAAGREIQRCAPGSLSRRRTGKAQHQQRKQDQASPHADSAPSSVFSKAGGIVSVNRWGDCCHMVSSASALVHLTSVSDRTICTPGAAVKSAVKIASPFAG